LMLLNCPHWMLTNWQRLMLLNYLHSMQTS
jgi:hypothetical protein